MSKRRPSMHFTAEQHNFRRRYAALGRDFGRCKGRMTNGPGKAFARCELCGRVDYELNEGDRCRADA